MKKEIRRLVCELGIILALSMGIATGVNALRMDSLPLFLAYAPAKTPPPVPGTESITEVDLPTLKALLAGDMVILVDAREEAAFRSGHIPGALNLPLGDRDRAYARVREDLLSNGRTIVAYCIDSGCLDSTQLAAWLRQKGHHDVMVFRGGIEGWRTAGNPVENSK